MRRNGRISIPVFRGDIDGMEIRIMPRVALLGLLLVGGFSAGCRETQSTAETHDMLREFGKLPELRQSTHEGLIDELTRIEEEQATPELLMTGGVADEHNVAVALRALFVERKLSSIYETSTEIYPADGLRFDPVQLQRAIDFKNRYSRQLADAREALKLDQCDFAFAHVMGYAADRSFVDLVRICGRLEAFAAAESLDAAHPAEAVESLKNMLLLARWLGMEKNVVARLETAYLRGEAWDVLAAIATHRETTDEEIIRLDGIVRDHLVAWPDDRDAWIGDRAQGLHTYEMIRAGHLQSVLTVDELKMFADEGIGGELAVAVHRYLDEDELFYLSTMRRVIGSCGQPYFERVRLFSEIRDQLRAMTGRPDYPFIAGRMLLIDVQRGHQIQAQDRALAEGWAVALALAVGREPAFERNPLSGRPYQVQVEETRVVVSDTASPGSDRDCRLVVPRVQPPGSTSDA